MGFWISWIPYALVTRALFLYHFLPPLLYAVLASMAYLDSLSLKPLRKKLVLVAILAVALFRFGTLAPVTFGITMSEGYFEWLQKGYLKGSP